MSIAVMLISCAGFDEYFMSNNTGFKDVQSSYRGKKIIDKTLQIQSIEGQCMDLRCKEGLRDNVRKGKSKDLFADLLQKKLPLKIRKNSTFKKVKYQTEQDSSDYDFTLILKNFVSTKIASNPGTTGGVTFTPSPFGGGVWSSYGGNYDHMNTKLLNGVMIHCTYEIIDNSNDEIVVKGSIGGFGELDCEKLKTKKKKKEKDRDYFDSTRVTYDKWEEATDTFGKELMKDTPFYKKAKKKKKDDNYYDFDKF